MKIFTPHRTRSGARPAWALLTILLGFLLLHLTSSHALAQGTYVCADPPYPGPCETHDYCDPGFHPGPPPYCIGLDGCDNPGQFVCIADLPPAPPPTPVCTCTPPGGGCGIQTAIGCIPTDLDAFAGFILERGIYLGILVAILLIIISGYGIISSTGDPERLAEAKSRLTAAIAGLLFLLFSVIILRIIACNIIGGEAKVFFCP